MVSLPKPSSERVFAKGRVGVRERPPVCVGNATARIFPADAFTGGEVVERDPALCVKRESDSRVFVMCMVMPPIKRDEELVPPSEFDEMSGIFASMQAPDQREWYPMDSLGKG